MVSFENFVKSMPPSLSELKVTPSLCFPFKIPDDLTATTIYLQSTHWVRIFSQGFFLFSNVLIALKKHLVKTEKTGE